MTDAFVQKTMGSSAFCAPRPRNARDYDDPRRFVSSCRSSIFPFVQHEGAVCRNDAHRFPDIGENSGKAATKAFELLVLPHDEAIGA
jgi:hypothetical protein